MRASTILFGLTATTLASAAVIPKDTAITSEVEIKTAVSPDGYVYKVETEAYVEDTITAADGTTHTVLVHPTFKRFVDEHGTSLNPNKEKRLSWYGGNADQCGNSNFINKTTGGSPTTGDCGEVRDYYRTANGYYSASRFTDLAGSDWCRLVITRTCVFGIKSANFNGASVGSTDISDLTRDAINKFQSGGRVGAEGEMNCNNSKVLWAIFHS
ncbi:hypothetical protein SMACR_04699 [Sordaria macrospora]|uniref:WGS project CABT00000000 data, contig 2.21 n=2 Tax=Sordaria macrospora TaxID=5147 RepID=F7W266_SORMK|nr:uncharacterized protein SMAC_04699 [Sordaria macrospora k-hell]KAA8632279.1 hypothetical protein SMACR_04699 [Sordaria macrospora]KAH7630916.1 putative necrosis-inducing factor-domain-containing protein [Sordaria sp. MPI-SDFR-AT-0083]WPJ61970.1 hypothetical protein SMAC4_04699 [Sordaria macrospora]CCC11716.1 unnamed protein product [Sordaria macrospora k-hell]